MWSSGSTSADLAKGKKFLNQLLYVQHVDKEKDTTSQIPEQSLQEHLVAGRNTFSDLNFTEYLKSPKVNLSILKSSLKDQITSVKVYSNPLPIALKSKVTSHAFVVFRTWNYSDSKETWWTIEKNGRYIVLQQSPDKDDVTEKIYDIEKKENVKRIGPVKELKSAVGNRKDLEYLFQAIWDTNQLRRRYHLLISNCQNFASFIFRKLNKEGKKWSTAVSATVDGLKFRNKITTIKVEALKYKSIVKDDKFDFYRAMIERRRKNFEELSNNLTIHSLNSVDSQGYTLLEWATVFSTSNWPIDEELMKKGAIIPSDQGLFRRNLFFIALQYLPCDQEFKRNSTKLLSLNGIAINGVNKTGDTALHLAMYGEKWEIVEKILNRLEGYYVNMTNSSGDTPLYLAAKRKCEIEVFKAILFRTITKNVNKADKNGYTALHWVIFVRSTEKITLLLGRGINSNARDVNGDTALHIAIEYKYEIAVKELLKDYRVDVNVENNSKRTALHLASKWKNIPIDLFKMILKRSSNINAKDSRGNTAIQIAILYEFETAIKELLEHKDGNNKKNCTSALHYACECPNVPLNLFQIILEKSSDINAKDDKGNTALHIAIMYKSKIAVKGLLTDKGVDVNIQNNNKLTALHFVCLWPSIPVDLFKIILKKSTDINAKDIEGNTALYYAISCKFKIAVNELLAHKYLDVNVTLKSLTFPTLREPCLTQMRMAQYSNLIVQNDSR